MEKLVRVPVIVSFSPRQNKDRGFKPLKEHGVLSAMILTIYIFINECLPFGQIILPGIQTEICENNATWMLKSC